MSASKSYDGQGLEPGRATALTELHLEVRTTLEEGRHIPCCGPDSASWLSDDAADQTVSADRCLDCPVYLACLEYVTAWPERGAVWAGIAPTRRGHLAVTDTNEGDET